MCARRESNPRPGVYKTPALPTELRAHKGIIKERGGIRKREHKKTAPPRNGTVRAKSEHSILPGSQLLLHLLELRGAPPLLR